MLVQRIGAKQMRSFLEVRLGARWAEVVTGREVIRESRGRIDERAVGKHTGAGQPH
jgi:hypothetical protein